MQTTHDSPPLACHDCDQLHPHRELAAGETAVCCRCGGLLARSGRDVTVRTFAYSVASLVLLIVANAFPFLSFQIAGRVQVALLSTGVAQLYADGYPELAAMVLFCSVVAPSFLIVGLLLLSTSMLAGRRYGWMPAVTKLIGRLKVWSMMEVFLLGVIVAAIKLSDMAEIITGPACLAFVGLILTSTAAISIFEPREVWEYLDGEQAR